MKRVWRPGDRITLFLNVSPRKLLGGRPPQLGPCGGDTSGKFCIYVGPLLLAYDPRFDVYDPRSLPGIDVTNQPELIEPIGHEPKPYALFKFNTTIGARPITLCDFASAGAMSGPYLSGLPLTSKIWQFSRESDNSVIASRLRLMADGSIQGHSHPNEVRWGLKGDTIVFFAENGDVTTKFTERDWGNVNVNHSVNHRMVVKGEFSFNHNIKHVLSELDMAITNKIWQFSRESDNSVIASRLRLMADGSIQGHSHPNEVRWGLKGDTIVFFAQNGEVTTEFTDISTREGKMMYKGRSLGSDSPIIHTLKEIDFAWNPYVSWFPIPI